MVVKNTFIFTPKDGLISLLRKCVKKKEISICFKIYLLYEAYIILENYIDGGIKKVPSVYTLLISTVYLFLSTQVAGGTVFRKHTEVYSI